MKLLIIFSCLTAGVIGQQYNYGEVLGKSILFYEAQRSGKLPSDNRVPWRGDSAMNDGQSEGRDLTGGWYDAGDHVKFGFPMAWSTTTLIWGFLDHRQGYISAGEENNMIKSIKWPLDYFLKCFGGATWFFGQCADGNADHAFWGRPEDMTMHRPCWAISEKAQGTDLAAETAAAMAAGYLAFRDSDLSYADQLLEAAINLFNFAYYQPRKLYHESITNAASFYKSSAYDDELAWGALWLYRATNNTDYLAKALEFYNGGPGWAFSWDNKHPGIQVLMYQLTGEQQYANDISGFLTSWFPGGSIPYTPKGLAWRNEWGSLRYSANTAFIALRAADLGVRTVEARNWAKGQIGYMLGNTGRSFVVGFGNNPPQRPHHRAASCNPRPAQCGQHDLNKPDPNPNVLYGALVGGPDQQDNYVDDRKDYQKNEVATDYNAGFQGAIAALKQLGLKQK